MADPRCDESISALVKRFGPARVLRALVKAGVVYQSGTRRMGGAELDGEYAPVYLARHENAAAERRIRRNR